MRITLLNYIGQALPNLGGQVLELMVIRLNDITRKVMQDEGIEIIDVYSILAGKLELAAGDQYHWKGPAYEIISNEIQKKIIPVIRQNF